VSLILISLGVNLNVTYPDVFVVVAYLILELIVAFVIIISFLNKKFIHFVYVSVTGVTLRYSSD
jgi:hypothetical protein